MKIKVSLNLKYLLLLILMFLHFQSKAQYVSPLDVVPKDKKVQLLKFGENNSTELLAEKTLRLFREAGDGGQKYTKVGFYKIIDINSDPNNLKSLNIPIEMINSLNKKEFADYLLAQYSDSLTIKEIIKINNMFKTKDGIRLKEYIRKTINEEPIESDFYTSGLFSDLEAFDVFF